MLDIADNLFEFLDKSELKLPEDQKERISLLLAENRDIVMPILRGLIPRNRPIPNRKNRRENPLTVPKPAKRLTVPLPDTNQPKNEGSKF